MRVIYFLLAIAFSIPIYAQKNSISVYDLRTEYKYNPLGIDTKQPRFSWKLSSTLSDVRQSSYEIKISSKGKSVTTGKQNSDQSHLVTTSGEELKPLTRYTWQVRVWDNKSNVSSWSNPSYFETGLMGTVLPASWIEPEKNFSDKTSLPPVYTRKEFDVSKKVASAQLIVTSRGLYRFYLNGKPVSEDLFTPGWTSYNKRLQYQVYDITAQLQKGKNAAGAILSEGWYRGTLGWVENRNLYGKKLGLLASIRIAYTDGTTELVNSDSSWKATDQGPIRFSGIYDGEIIDANMELNGWSSAGFNDTGWWNVALSGNQKQTIVANDGEAVRRVDEIKPVKIFKTPKGEQVLDMGQNMVGWMRIRVSGSKGNVVKVYHAEVLDQDGNFYTENLRDAKALLQYTCKGTGAEIFEPQFTFMGFRYIRIEGVSGELKPEDFTGIVIHSDMKASGSLETSNSTLNQLQQNIQWGQRGNFLDVPTDCPQRDERLGWTGDAQAFVRTASYNYDIASFFTKWLKDVAADQASDGGVPFVVPDVLRGGGVSAGWGDVAVIAPMTIYTCYGDKQLLTEQYASMKKYVDYIKNKSGDSMIWKGGSVFGDWLYYHPGEFDHTTSDGHTDRDLVATAFYAYSTTLLIRAAEILGKDDDKVFYSSLLQKIKDAYNREYVSPSGRVFSGSQTSYVLSLMFDLLPEDRRTAAAAFLVNDIKSRSNHLSTGFLGTPYLCHVLSRFGYDSVAYDLLFQDTYPSWLYPVKMGATTIWERWDGMRPDKTFQDVGMNSFNHYAYGAIGEWMYTRMAGIDTDPASPGYKHFFLRPVPTAKLDSCAAVYESPYGKIHSSWKKESNNYQYRFSIPANSSASIVLTYRANETLMINGKKAESKMYTVEADKVKLELGSGEYMITMSH